jgi:hypothetical protein
MSAVDAVSTVPALVVISALRPELELKPVPADHRGLTVVKDEDPDRMWRPLRRDEGITMLIGQSGLEALRG